MAALPTPECVLSKMYTFSVKLPALAAYLKTKLMSMNHNMANISHVTSHCYDVIGQKFVIRPFYIEQP